MAVRVTAVTSAVEKIFTIVGRQIWHVLADSLSFVYVGPLAGVLMLTLVPAALVVLALLAVWPARGAARLHTAEVLRAE